jgi:hypothetical protein
MLAQQAEVSTGLRALAKNFDRNAETVAADVFAVYGAGAEPVKNFWRD